MIRSFQELMPDGLDVPEHTDCIRYSRFSNRLWSAAAQRWSPCDDQNVLRAAACVPKVEQDQLAHKDGFSRLSERIEGAIELDQGSAVEPFRAFRQESAAFPLAARIQHLVTIDRAFGRAAKLPICASPRRRVDHNGRRLWRPLNARSDVTLRSWIFVFLYWQKIWNKPHGAQ